MKRIKTVNLSDQSRKDEQNVVVETDKRLTRIPHDWGFAVGIELE